MWPDDEPSAGSTTLTVPAAAGAVAAGGEVGVTAGEVAGAAGSLPPQAAERSSETPARALENREDRRVRIQKF